MQQGSHRSQRQQLSEYVALYQQRNNSEEVDALSKSHNITQSLCQRLQTDIKRGIDDSEEALKTRQARWGGNTKKQIQPPGLFKLFCNALEDFTLRILLVAAVLSIVLETATADDDDRSIAWIQGFAILVAVFVCASVTAVNDYQKEKQFKQLNSSAEQHKMISIIRGGKNVQLHQDLLLVGDIVILNQGMEVPADGLILQADQITVDESAMTGESQAMNKNVVESCASKKEELKRDHQYNQKDKLQVPSPILMSGTKLLTGQGKMMVLVVGNLSCLGKLREMLQHQDPEPTPLQQKLDKVAEDIGKFGLYSAIFIVIALLIRFGIVRGTATVQEDKWQTGRDLVKILHFFILGITVIVVAIPEGLPLSVTLSLAFSVKKMLDHNNLVRRMQACETMGGANNICSDKTGTLTLNKMTVSQIWNGETIKVDIKSSTLKQESLSQNTEYVELFKLASLVNSSARLTPTEKGSSTEIAFLKYFQKMGVDYATYRKKYKIKVKFPFSSSRKRMSVILPYKEQLHMFSKGASEMVLKGCQKYYNPRSGQIEQLDRSKADEAINKMAKYSLRTLCLAYKKVTNHENFAKKDDKGVHTVQNDGLILLAIVGVRDVPRPEVPRAIELCHQAGITVRMVTGDNIETAKAIAKQIGLFKNNPNAKALEGLEFSRIVGGVVCKKCRVPVCGCPQTRQEAQERGQQLRVDTVANEKEFDKLKDDLLVLARSRPEDKYCLVTGLKERGNVVAVTGDGTNDAPALKKADVGFAMGISGTEVAREAAAIILVDDNFSSIVKSVLWGRNIYDSIRKFIQFQLTVNVVAVVITLIGAALLQKQVLRPIQMLWVNLIMDTLASLALATEDPHPDLLLRQPHPRDEYIVSKTMVKHIIGQSIFQITVMLILIFMGEQFIPEYPDSYDSNPLYLNNPHYKWKDGQIGGNIVSGRFYFLNGDKDYQQAFQATNNYSRHFTIVFNAFVLLQWFNFINARKLHEQINVFKGIFDNHIFLIIVSGILVIQIILVTFSGYAFGLYGGGLTIQHWLICAGLGAGSLVVSFLLKLLPIAQEVQMRDQLRENARVVQNLMNENSMAQVESSKVILDSLDSFQTMKANIENSQEVLVLEGDEHSHELTLK